MPQPPSSRELALNIVQRLQRAGHVAYFAGGCVRDQLMQRDPKDYDVATDALPQEVLRLFPRSQKVGVAFGVVLVKEKQRQVEVATFRSDGVYSDGRHPDSVQFTTAQEDAKRRDFTCNGLFYDPVADTVHDFVNGRADIEARIIRAIGDPHQRFAEDHLRMLRAVRFAARLEFTIEPTTRTAIEEMQSRIELISRERIGEEIRMMLEHPTREVATELLAGFPRLFAEVFGFAAPADVAWPVLSGLPQHTIRAVALVAILLDTGHADLKSAAQTLRTRLMLSNDELEEILFLVEKLPVLEKWEDRPKHTLKRIMADPRWHSLEALYRADPENADQLLAFAERTTTLAEEGVAPAPLITGDILIKLGATPGPSFRRWLDLLYDRQLDGELRALEEALAAARALIQQG
jgi:tRNA nucleotidyltransferase/poly(A) polymerase